MSLENASLVRKSRIATSKGRVNRVDCQSGDISCNLQFKHAGLRPVTVAYHSTGRASGPLVVVAGGISANRYATSRTGASAGWWQTQVGPGLAIDTNLVRVLGIDWIGADGRSDFPIDSSDQAQAIALAVEALGAKRVAVFVGASYGAMVGLHFAAQYGSRLDHLIAISGAHKAHPFSSAWRSLQREILRSQPDHAIALSLARQLAMLSYRTPEEFQQRFPESPQLTDGRVYCASDSYLKACGEKFARGWSLTAYLRLSESVDLHAIEPGSIRTPTTLVAVAEDRLVPSTHIHSLASQLGARRVVHHLSSRYGHDAFLKEHDAISRILRTAMADAVGEGHGR